MSVHPPGVRPSHHAKTAHGPVLGMVASLSDITRQHELQQTKNDVIALVSHEMRTPLTAIQGMTELLANYDLDRGPPPRDEPGHQRRGEAADADDHGIPGHHAAGSGATALRRSPVRVETLLERTLLLLDPLAAQRQIQLVRRFDGELPPVLADADLLARAVENLVSNAIKYSPPGNGGDRLRARRRTDSVADRSGRPGLRDSGRGSWTAFSKSSIGFRAWRTRIRRAPAWVWRWCARSRNCMADP